MAPCAAVWGPGAWGVRGHVRQRAASSSGGGAQRRLAPISAGCSRTLALASTTCLTCVDVLGHDVRDEPFPETR